jgi:hypothetical protein
LGPSITRLTIITGQRQWSLKRERARYEAERARRQYDAVEPENRLVARSLERVWEDKLRQAEQIDIEYESWRRQQPVSLAGNRTGATHNCNPSARRRYRLLLLESPLSGAVLDRDE